MVPKNRASASSNEHYFSEDYFLLERTILSLPPLGGSSGEKAFDLLRRLQSEFRTYPEAQNLIEKNKSGITGFVFRLLPPFFKRFWVTRNQAIYNSQLLGRYLELFKTV